ncbi:MAG: serine hydrolase [Candidatus Kapaibacterium sp.]|jgi:D-alanyl-D-alanine carboxypeptidase
MNPTLASILLCAALCCRVFAQPVDNALAGRLQNTIDSLRAEFAVPGVSACVYVPGRGVWQGVSGTSHAGVAIQPSMQFAIASNTKLFTGVLLLKLMQNKLLRLEDSLHSYLPPYANIDSNITIRQLLNNTSGLDDVTSVPGYPDSMLSNPRRIYTATELLRWAGAPEFAPGRGWSYCNTNYLIAGLIAEKVTGQPYHRLLRDSILTPLGLDSTFLDVYEDGRFTVAHPWQAGVDNFSVPRVSVNSAAWSAGAMYSTASEMVQWYRALMSGKVLGSEGYKELTTFVGSGKYSTGLSEDTFVGRIVWQHGGSIWGGYNSTMIYDTSSGIVVCVLTNKLPGQPLVMARQLLLGALNTPVSVESEDTNTDVHATALDACIYPNPGSESISITMPGAQVDSVAVYSAAGSVMIANSSPTLSVSNLPAGVYFVHAHTAKGTAVLKLVKL